jgi:hypothetical protein
MDAPKPLKIATRRLQGRGKQGSFVVVAEIMLVFGLLFNCYVKRVDSYEAVDYNAHDKTPEGHFSTYPDVAWVKAKDYYDKPDDIAIYYTVTLLHTY